jgi:hypothetical protein
MSEKILLRHKATLSVFQHTFCGSSTVLQHVQRCDSKVTAVPRLTIRV